jgi:small neutral amino acid transporter SnatA (MarC family)
VGDTALALIVGFGGGLFCIVSAIMNWDWFFNNRRAYIFVKVLGRTGARVFYGLLGAFLFVMGFNLM